MAFNFRFSSGANYEY